MALPIDFSMHSSEKPFSNSTKSPMPFLTPNLSRFLSTMSDQKLPRFLGNISNPIFWRHFPPYMQYDQKQASFNPAMYDKMSSKSSRTRFNHLPMSSVRLFSPQNSFLDKFNHCKSSAVSNSLSNLFDSWNQSTGSDKTSLTGFPSNPTMMISLQSGVKKRLEEITEFDFWHCTQENDQFNPQWSEVVHLSPMSDEKKIEITFLTNNKQILYQTDLHRLFFVKNVGWCSLFPALTQKIFGIHCSLMDIGHSCLTLSRKRKHPAANTNNVNYKRSKDSPRSHLSFHSNSL